MIQLSGHTIESVPDACEDVWVPATNQQGHVRAPSGTRRCTTRGLRSNEFDPLVPDNEFDPLVSVHDSTVDEFKLLREESNGLAYRLVVAREKRVVVFIPIYYEFPAVDRLRVAVEAARGPCRCTSDFSRRRKGVLGYTLDEPELLFPDA